jgi:hypothetical protein
VVRRFLVKGHEVEFPREIAIEALGAADTFKFMTRNSLKQFRYAAGSVNLFGLMLSAGTWACNICLCTHPLSGTYRAFIRTLGVFCWTLGLLLFIIAWVAEGFACGRWGAR